MRSGRRLLLAGDRVAFGVRVGDADTAASALQRLVGNGYEVVNAGVGGYGPDEILATIDTLSAEREFAGLVYIASACRGTE